MAEVVDQFNKPVSGAVVVVNGIRAETNVDGEAVIGQLPLGEYDAQVIYRGVKTLNLKIKLEKPEAFRITLPLYKLRIEIVNEIGMPLDVSASLYRAGTFVAGGNGSTIEFNGLPAGNYQLTLRRGSKEISRNIPLSSDRTEKITFPILLEIGSIALSTQEAMLVILPLSVVILAVMSILIVRSVIRRFRRGKAEKPKPSSVSRGPLTPFRYSQPCN